MAAFDRDGVFLFFSQGGSEGCELARLRVADRKREPLRLLPFCPETISVAEDGTLLVSGRNGSLVIDSTGRDVPSAGHVISMASKTNFVAEQGGRFWWHRDGAQHSIAWRLRSPRIVPGADVVVAIVPSEDGESLVRFSTAASHSITSSFRAIDSFDVAPNGKEIVFSADGGHGFDVGLVSMDGGEVRWIYPDPLPERLVTWAPRGNKVSYVLEGIGGSILRTVHVPTSFQLSVDFPWSRIVRVSWEPKAEKFAVVTSSIDRDWRIEWLRYGGEERTTLVESSEQAEGEIDRIGNAVLMTPQTIRYGQRYPLVVWLTDRAFEWNAARMRLHKHAEVGTVLVAPDEIGGPLWEALMAVPWVDKDRLFVVYREPLPARSLLPDGRQVTVIAPTVERRNSYRIERDHRTIVSIASRSPEAIDAFAAGYIERRLKESGPLND